MSTDAANPRLYPTAEATRIASELASGDADGWTYTVEHIHSGVCRIRVTDENQEFIGYW